MAQAALSLNISLLGQDIFNRRMATVEHGLLNWFPLWQKVAVWFYAMEAAQFASQGHGTWAPLADSTQADRAGHGYGAAAPILERSGALLASLFGGEGSIYESEPLSITLGTDLQVASGNWILATLHETGTSRMPARPPIGRGMEGGGFALFQSDLMLLRSLFSRYVHGLVKEAAA